MCLTLSFNLNLRRESCLKLLTPSERKIRSLIMEIFSPSNKSKEGGVKNEIYVSRIT